MLAYQSDLKFKISLRKAQKEEKGQTTQNEERIENSKQCSHCLKWIPQHVYEIHLAQVRIIFSFCLPFRYMYLPTSKESLDSTEISFLNSYSGDFFVVKNSVPSETSDAHIPIAKK